MMFFGGVKLYHECQQGMTSH